MRVGAAPSSALIAASSPQIVAELAAFRLCGASWVVQTYIYGLLDPRDQLVHYVGKSDRPRQRLTEHLKDAASNPYKAEWLEDLSVSGGRPRIVILETVSLADWEQAERRWIATGRDLEWPLTNIQAGGRVGGSGKQLTAKWANLIRPFLSAEDASKIDLFPESHLRELCRQTAIAALDYSWTAIAERGGDPRDLYSKTQQFWQASCRANVLLYAWTQCNSCSGGG